MAGLPKSLIKKYGISKKAWAVFRAGHHSSGKSSMSKKKKGWRYAKRLKRRFGKAKVPFEVLIAAGTLPWTPAQSGCMTPIDALQAGNMVELMGQLKSGFLGIDIFNSGAGVDIVGSLNPFNMERCRYTKTLIIAGLYGMLRRKITGRYTNPMFKKIPLLGRIVN